ncbi:MAG: phenylacetic acid degradation protein PaaD, partial [Rhodobacteraceae bacterium]|nr:phenylacetic acid degradation protein PaaD [Paracoccaceae bacterium]
ATVAQHNTITYVNAGRLGDELVATAREISKSGRNGIYDVDVTNQNGSLIASFRGCSRTIKGQNFPE